MNRTCRTRRRRAVAAALALVALAGGCGPGEAETEQQSMDRAWEALRIANVTTARRLFEQLSSSADPTLRAEALYGWAASLSLPQTSPDVPRARELYRRAIEIDPKSDTAAWSSLALARLVDLRDLDIDSPALIKPEARDEYRKVMRDFPGHPAATEARLHLIASLVTGLKPDEAEEAIRLVDEFLPAIDGTPWAPNFLSLKSNALRTLGRHEERLATEIRGLEIARATDKFQASEYAGNMYAIGVIAETEVGDVATAREYYFKVIDEYPADVRVYPAIRALMRLEEYERQLAAEAGIDYVPPPDARPIPPLINSARADVASQPAPGGQP